VEMEFKQGKDGFVAPCPCGDVFFISVDELFDNEEKAGCASCSLVLRVKYDPDQVRARFGEDEEERTESSE